MHIQIHDICLYIKDDMISQSHPRCILPCMNTGRRDLRNMPASTPSSPHVQKLATKQPHCEQISVTSLNLQCAPVEKEAPSAVSSSLAASLKMVESAVAVCT